MYFSSPVEELSLSSLQPSWILLRVVICMWQEDNWKLNFDMADDRSENECNFRSNVEQGRLDRIWNSYDMLVSGKMPFERGFRLSQSVMNTVITYEKLLHLEILSQGTRLHNRMFTNQPHCRWRSFVYSTCSPSIQIVPE